MHVQGDQRTHSHVVALRAVTSSDGMTADWCALHTERSITWPSAGDGFSCRCYAQCTRKWRKLTMLHACILDN